MSHIGFLNEQNKWAEVSRPSYELKTVTHWQHLPAPPIGKEVKNKTCLYYPENLLCAIFDKFSYDEIGANCDIETAKERVELKINVPLQFEIKTFSFCFGNFVSTFIQSLIVFASYFITAPPTMKQGGVCLYFILVNSCNVAENINIKVRYALDDILVLFGHTFPPTLTSRFIGINN